MLECPNCFAAVHESNNRCLRCGKTISAETAKALPKQTAKFKEGIVGGILSAILVLGLVGGIGFGMYKAYIWWTFRQDSKKVAHLKVGRHQGSDYPLLDLHLSFKLRNGQGFVTGRVVNRGKRWIGDVVYRYSCNEPSTGATFNMGPFGPGETRVFDQFLFDARKLDDCSSYVDFVDVAQ
jgi:hypothetical protein